jgi:hypothetical protein
LIAFYYYVSSLSFLVILFVTLPTFNCAVFFLERLVNVTVEKTRTKERASISEGADNIGIPRMLVDVRHGKKTCEK